MQDSGSIPGTQKSVSKGVNRHLNNEDVQMMEKAYKMPKMYPAERGSKVKHQVAMCI